MRRSKTVWGITWRGGSAPRHGIALISAWIDRWRQRRALEALDARLLSDIGVSCTDARREADRPFWLK